MTDETTRQPGGTEVAIYIDRDADQAADTEGHRFIAYVEPHEIEWAMHAARLDDRRTPVRLAEPTDGDDTEGHALAQQGVVRVVVVDDDDTEGHAISLRFPSVEEADQFRRRLLATGLIAGSLVVGAVGIGIAQGPAAAAPAADRPAVVTDAGPDSRPTAPEIR